MNLILDVVVLVLLGMTIVYAARLSLQLKRLRDSRGDMDKIVRELVRNIDKAERAVLLLRESADEQGGKLQRIIGNAVSLADELQMMTESGDRLASRLEKLAEGVAPITRDIQARAEAMAEKAEVIMSAKMRHEEAEPRRLQPMREQKDVRDNGRGAALGGEAAGRGQGAEVRAYSEHLRKLDGADVEVISSQGSPMFAIRDPEVERGIDPMEQGVGDDPSLYSEAERDLLRALKGL